MQLKTNFEITEDGSHTLFVPQINEHYHSTHGAVQESMHVYINAGLRECTKKHVHILEIGFGTGLNAYLSLLEAEKIQKTIEYTALELYPISLEKATLLNYSVGKSIQEKDWFMKLHQSDWNSKQVVTYCFSIEKLITDVSKTSKIPLTSSFDVIYFDAFAPKKQPELWTTEIFQFLYDHCNTNAILTTYCAKGSVRRMLQSVGFTVERLPGPPGKREILRAIK
ncbi:MAG: tRNA (5-methylaminomethyl-2-thiouridine)(34)-methyltransferase MnmD [Dysgonamonadaceae bacterium]